MTFLKPYGPTPAATLLAFLLLGCSGGGADLPPGAAQPPPVLLITVDGLVAGELSAFGGERPTPALAALAGDATVWREGWTTSPMTRPAVATYLTGLAPDRHRVVDDLASPLPEGIPTLAALLGEKGYATAAFPGSSLLGPSSGLLRDFAIVDDPPPPPFGPSRWIPLSADPADLAGHFALWLEGLETEAPWFAWLHFSAPLLEQLDELGRTQFGVGEERRLDKLRDRARAEAARRSPPAGGEEEGSAGQESLRAFDDAVGALLAALEARGGADRVLVVLAPTMGEVDGGASEPPGPGFSLDERAVRVPFLIRFPSGTARPRSEDSAAWAPDVAATIAGMTGVELPAEAEGLDLLESLPEDRVTISWSWATRDQMGWLPLRAARFDAWRRIEGLEEKNFHVDGAESRPDAEALLADALSARAELPPVRVEREAVRPWFEANALTVDPLPAEGRPFGPADARRDAAALVWSARHEFRREEYSLCLISWRGALEGDRRNLAALVGLGQTLSMIGAPRAEVSLRKAVEWYPGDWDALHWLAHAIWNDSWSNAEELLVKLLPYRPDEPDLLFDLACTRSLDGDTAAAEEYLRAALEAGFDDWNLVESVASLRNLRETPRFSALLREYGR